MKYLRRTKAVLTLVPKYWLRAEVLLALSLLIAAAVMGQTTSAKKSYTFHGKVEAVAADGISVNGEKVEGWMDAMTMKYKVDDPKVLKTVKVGDQINATVYDGDFTTLHKVQVTKPGK